MTSETSDVLQTCDRAVTIREAARDNGTIAERRYLDSFDLGTKQPAGSRGIRLLPKSSYNEFNEPLPTEAAMGHLMMTAGLGNEQHFWRNLRSAYTGDRVRKLAKDCDRVSRYVTSVSMLRKSLHPKHGTMLVVGARRMCKAVVGDKLDLFGGPLQMAAIMPWDVGDGFGIDNFTAVQEAMARPLPSFIEDTQP